MGSDGFIRLIAAIILTKQVVADVKPISDFNFYNSGELGLAPNQTFHTINYTLPLFQNTRLDRDHMDGSDYLFVTPFGDQGLRGPMIYDARTLSPVYADMSFVQVGDFRVQQYKGSDFLTFGSLNSPPGYTHCRLYDSSYQLAYTISAVNITDEVPDLHECQLTSDGTALITVSQVVPYDLSPVGGSINGSIMEAIVQEIDIATGELVFEWRASEHMDISESFYPVNDSIEWDFCHMNSMEKSAEGNILLSMRHLNAVRYINATDGSMIWQLGGKQSTFIDNSNSTALDFSYQHYARFVDDDFTQLTLFDNGAIESAPGCSYGCSRGMHLELDHSASTAKLIQEYQHPKGLEVGAMGSMQRLPGGNVVLSWGTFPTMTEYTADGTNVGEFEWGVLADHNAYSYRGLKMNWTAKPPWPPTIAAQDNHVYLSWNGATEARKWAVLAGDSSENLDGVDHVLAVVEKEGFETQVFISSSKRFVRAAALDVDGIIIGSTAIVDLITGDTQPAGNITSVNRCWVTMYSCACEAAYLPKVGGGVDSDI